jgi:hypothetical protein
MISRPVDADSGTPSTNRGARFFSETHQRCMCNLLRNSRVTLFAWGECEDHWPASQLWVLISSNLYTEQTLAHPSYAKNTLADFIGVEISAPDQAHRQNLDEPPKFIDDPSRLGEALIR